MSDEKKRGRGRRNDIPWPEIRKRFEAGETNVSKLSREFGVKRESIIKRRDREKWTTPGQVADSVRSNVISIATRKALEEVAPELEKAIAVGLTRHAEIETLLLDVAKDVLEKAKAGTLKAGKIQSEADVYKAAIDAASKAVDKSREINGLRSGQPSAPISSVNDEQMDVTLTVRGPKSAAS